MTPFDLGVVSRAKVNVRGALSIGVVSTYYIENYLLKSLYIAFTDW
jgi:hypothetical protein